MKKLLTALAIASMTIFSPMVLAGGGHHGYHGGHHRHFGHHHGRYGHHRSYDRYRGHKYNNRHNYHRSYWYYSGPNYGYVYYGQPYFYRWCY